MLAVNYCKNSQSITLVEIGLVEVVWSWDVHIIETSNLPALDITPLWRMKRIAYITMPSEML